MLVDQFRIIKFQKINVCNNIRKKLCAYLNVCRRSDALKEWSTAAKFDTKILSAINNLRKCLEEIS